MFTTYLLATKRHPHLEESIFLSIFEIGKEDKTLLNKFFQNLKPKDSENMFLSILKILSDANKFNVIKAFNNYEGKVIETISNISKEGFTCTSINIIFIVFKEHPEFF